MNSRIKQLLREGLVNDSVNYYKQDEDDEYEITKVTIDDYHRYERCDGILYELSGSGDIIVYVNEIEHTEENQFYDDQIQRYVKYLEDGGALESFPVDESSLGGVYSLEGMCDYLGDGDNFDLMYDLVNIKDSKARVSLYDAIDSLSYDSESFGIEPSTLSKIRNVSDLNKYYGSNYLSNFDEDEIEEYYWEQEYYLGFKRILEYWFDNKEYTLTDMNHRFMAVKSFGIDRVYIDPS